MKSSAVALSFGAASVVVGALLVFLPEFLLTPVEVARASRGGSDLWAVPQGVGVLGLAVFCGGMFLLGAALNRAHEAADTLARQEAPHGVQPV